MIDTLHNILAMPGAQYLLRLAAVGLFALLKVKGADESAVAQVAEFLGAVACLLADIASHRAHSAAQQQQGATPTEQNKP